MCENQILRIFQSLTQQYNLFLVIELCHNLQDHTNTISNAYSMLAPFLGDNLIFWDENGKITLQGCVRLLLNAHYLTVTN